MALASLLAAPGLETDTDWVFVPDGVATAARSTIDPYEGDWGGRIERVADGAVFGGFRNGAAEVVFTRPLDDLVRSLTVRIKNVNTPGLAVQLDPGIGAFITDLAIVTPSSSYTLLTIASFMVTGPDSPRLRFVTQTGGEGVVFFDNVLALGDVASTLEPYPDGDISFEESYFDDLRGTIHKRGDMTRDTQDRLVRDWDLDEPDRDDVLVEWPQPEEREDIEP